MAANPRTAMNCPNWGGREEGCPGVLADARLACPVEIKGMRCYARMAAVELMLARFAANGTGAGE